MTVYRPNLQDHYRRRHRLAAHSGVLAFQGHQKKQRRSQRLRIAAISMLTALVVLTAALIYPLGPRAPQTSQAPKLSPTGIIRHIAESGSPRIIPETPVVETPKAQSKPKAATPSFTSAITINGDDSCKQDTLAALQLLADKAPEHYQTVTQYVGVIECVIQGSGMAAYEDPPRYLVGDATRRAGTIWYAGTIAHDAGHSKLYHDYLYGHPGEAVPADIWTGQAAEAACLNAQYDALQHIGADQATLTYVQDSINSDYWNIPYNERWW